METVFVALGSNLENPVGKVRKAIEQIAQFSQTKLQRCSALYRTPPWGICDQDDFINAVIEVKTALAPSSLLSLLLALERKHGRVRNLSLRWGPRTLDCDILLYGNRVIQEAHLVVPHPHIQCRLFVLLPLSELAPNKLIQGKSVKAWLDDIPLSERKKVQYIETVE